LIVSYRLDDVSDPEFNRHDEWRVRIRYSYKLDSTFYSGFVRLAPWETDEDSAARFSRDLIKKKILVCYQPNAPAKSLYREPVDFQGMPMMREDGLIRRAFWLCFR
jgi:hypothetical protein